MRLCYSIPGTMTTVVLIPIAVALFSHITFLASLVLGFNFFAFLIALPASVAILIPIRRIVQPILHQRPALPIALVWISACVILLPLFQSHSFMQTPEGWVSGGGAWGDYAWHSTIIHHFAQRPRISLEHPLLAGHVITYPFLIDFFSAILLRAGFSIQHALLIPGVLLASNLVALVFAVTRQITRNTLAALFTILLFFFNGGLGWWFAIGDFQNSSLSFTRWISTLNTSYTFNDDLNIFFSNIIADYLIPQRPILLGLSFGIIILWLFWEAAHVEGKQRSRLFITLGFLAGLLPFAHQHTFLSLAILLPLLLLFARGPLAKRRLVDVLAVGVPATLVALPQLLWYMTHLQTERYFKFVIGWMAEGESLIIFWWKNLGFFLPLAVVATVLAPPKARWFLLPLWLLFLLTNVVQFQPYNYDNMKLMLFWLLVMAIAVSILLCGVARRIRRILRIPFYLVAIFVLTASGVLTVTRESHQRWLLYDPEAVALAEWVKANTRPEDRFLTSDAHNHPIPGLTGRPIVLGYRGWLWSHGLDYGRQEVDLREMLALSQKGRELLRSYNIRYIVIGPSERQITNTDMWTTSSYHVLFKSLRYTIYRIS